MLGLIMFQISSRGRFEHFTAVGMPAVFMTDATSSFAMTYNLAVRNLNEIIFKARVKGNCQVARDRPGRGRPDDEVNVVLAYQAAW